MEDKLEQLLVQHLNGIWNQRDETLRRTAIDRVYAKDISLFEVGEKFTGHQDVNHKISKTLNGLPPVFSIVQLKPIIINNNIGKLDWGVGPAGAPPVATGTDIVIFENEKIKSLYVFLNK
ncbi:hypothetical protein [Ohtaekwangia koreensis]|uniref:SnoaL-like domain-containing protein n=1 Tax=Ohtaekwangia koreensis TaxID=688867 RepID=A0A1T5JQL7_9BACT|nr:hypothetical protein [Ohtaekwangia koreensis]SKC53670.1 hypothetical protein SAMN05660236_1372 [Ohtaekwangia koreensis]